MAILALTTSLQDMRERIGKMVVAYDRARNPVTAEDIGSAGAATVLMKEAIKPNLMQTLENTPALVHAGPFANIAHGNSSIIADLIAMHCGDYVVTESGFGADIGAEKFFNIKSRISGLKPNAVVVVVTIRALKAHTGKYTIIPGKPIDPALKEENVADVEAGAVNMVRHLENLMKFGVNPVVAINVFADDTDAEIDAVREIALANGATGVAVARHWAEGGAGAAELAEMIVSACDMPNDFRLLYPDDMAIKDKIETIAREIYRADGVDYSPIASRKIRQYEAQGLRELPICMAKTHLSPQRQSQTQRRARWLPHRHHRYPRVRWRRLHLSALRRCAHHARLGPQPGRDECRYRRRRQGRRLVLNYCSQMMRTTAATIANMQTRAR